LLILFSHCQHSASRQRLHCGVRVWSYTKESEMFCCAFHTLFQSGGYHRRRALHASPPLASLFFDHGVRRVAPLLSELCSSRNFLPCAPFPRPLHFFFRRCVALLSRHCALINLFPASTPPFP
jgi:hypothetical protein